VVGAAAAIANHATNMISKFSGDVADGSDDLFTLRASPQPVQVEIGSFFQHLDMVITQISFSFSKEMTRNGPLYLDATISLSSRFIINDISKAGFMDSTTPRVSIGTAGLQTGALGL
jgi:hypothetical protein